ncbi:MAG: DUF4340 domain-containing protein [Proteobacteria bacterium]|nr:DUF4340 domain-containing protein [Pseudomonadota bacterium]
MKQPNWKPAFYLSATVFTLGSFTYWLQFAHKPKQEREDTLLKKPLPFRAESEQIAAFRIKSGSGLIEGKCESLAQKTCKIGSTAEWSLTYPEKLKGDAARIRDFLNNVSGMTSADTLDLSEETPEKQAKLLEEYGLSDAKRTALNTSFIELTLEGGRKVTAWFGETHPIGDKIFVGSAENGVLNGKRVFLVANFYQKSLFEKNLTYFRDKSLFAFDRANVEEFKIKTARETLSGKRVNGLWEINGMEADHDRMETLLSGVAQAEAKEFVDETTLKGARAETAFEAMLKDGSKVSFALFLKTSGKKPDEKKSLYLKSPGLKTPVEVESGFQAKPGGIKMDAAKATELLEQLSSAHNPEIVVPAPKPADDSVVLTLGTKEKGDLYRYRLYEVKDKAYARDLNSSRNEAFLLHESLKKAFPFRPDSWKMGK